MSYIDALSISTCKLCGTVFPTIKANCTSCKQYCISFYTGYGIESEMISYGNYRFIFLLEAKQAHVLECQNSKYKILNHINMEELTPELATYWLDKLKKYIIFQ